MMNSCRILICCLVLWCPFVLPIYSSAGEITLTPSIAIQGRYDNNVLFTRIDPFDDYSSIVKPAFRLDSVSERTKLNLGGDVAFINYLDHTDLDTSNQNYYLNVNHSMSERLSTGANIGYVLDTLLDSELEQSGRVFDREDRERYHAGGDMNFRLSQKTGVSARYNFARIDYEKNISPDRNETRSDRNEHAVRVSYRRFFNEGLDSVTVQPAYRYLVVFDDFINDTEKQDILVNSYSLNLGWTHKSSEVGTIRIFGGGRYTEELPSGKGSATANEETSNFGFVADLSYAIEDEISSFKIGYSRNINFDAENDLREVDRLYTQYRHYLTERSQAGLRASIYLTRSEDSVDSAEDNDTRFFNLAPWLTYSLTERHVLKLTYRYSVEYDNNVEDNKTVDRGQVTLAVVFKFPKKY